MKKAAVVFVLSILVLFFFRLIALPMRSHPSSLRRKKGLGDQAPDETEPTSPNVQ